MAVKAPSIDDLAHIAENLSFSLQTEDLESFRGLMASSIVSGPLLSPATQSSSQPADQGNQFALPMRSGLAEDRLQM